MKEMFIISTYNPEIVGSANYEAGMIDTMYYECSNQFTISKQDARLFDSYPEAQDIIELYELSQSQIEKVFI